MPNLPVRDGSLELNHLALMNAHGLLPSDMTTTSAQEKAEQELARIMTGYSYGETVVSVGPGKYKTSSLVLALYKLYRRRGGRGFRFRVCEPEDILAIIYFMSDHVIKEAIADPSKHPFITYILECLKNGQSPLLSVQNLRI